MNACAGNKPVVYACLSHMQVGRVLVSPSRLPRYSVSDINSNSFSKYCQLHFNADS